MFVGPGSAVDEADARADVNIAVVHPAEATAAPGEVHLGNQHPVASWGDGDDLGVMPIGARALHARRLIDHRTGHRDGATSVAGAVYQVRLAGMEHERPPVAVAEAGAPDVV